MRTLRLMFLGAAGTVTGAKYWLSVGDRNYLIDCGLFQGPDELEAANWAPLPFQPSALDAVVLTHAHVDHSGYVPRLVHDGYSGPIYASAPTIELLGLLLPDAGHLEEEQAEYANRKGYSRHMPALPLYTADEARRSLRQLRPLAVNRKVQIDDVLAVTLHRAGHILGSAIVECDVLDGDRHVTVVFSGDLGRYHQPIMREPGPVGAADYVIVESTYGDSEHLADPAAHALGEAIVRTVRRHGVVVIPAFAVGRTQEVLYYLKRLEDAHRIPELPVYIDSPMAIDATELYARFGDEHNLRIDLRSTEDDSPLRPRSVQFVRAAADSKKLNDLDRPAIIISASGMCSGGRIMHHLKRRLPDERNTVLLVGFQAAGTRGRALQDDARSIRIHGEDVPVRAHVQMIDGLSAHGDQSDILQWLGNFERPPRHTFVVHGEPDASDTLVRRIRALPGWRAHAPVHGESVEL